MTPTVPTNITTATTTLVKTGAGILRGIQVNTTAAGTIGVFDGLTAVNPIGTLKASVVEGTYFQVPARLKTGLTIVTGAASDITVFYE